MKLVMQAPVSLEVSKVQNPLSLSLPQERIIEASNLPAIIDMYLADRRSTISPKAHKNYRVHLRRFSQWWRECADNHQNQLSQAAMRHLVDWLENEYIGYMGQPATPYNIAHTLVMLRRVLRWAYDKGGIGQDVSELVPVYDAKKRPKYWPKAPELERLINACAGAYRVRNMALWAFLISTGARRNEVSNAMIQHLTFNTPVSDLRVDSDHMGVIHFRVVKGDSAGAGDGRRSVFCSKTGLLLKLWLLLSGRTEGTIFDLYEAGIRKMINTCAAKAGIERMHPHACRSAFMSYWVRVHSRRGDRPKEYADIALRFQVGHAQIAGDAQTHYLSEDPEWRLDLIREFYVSPMDEINVDWSRLPVQQG
jgi:integrase